MASDLICCICDERYNKKGLLPKYLPCRHTFCRQCLVLCLQQNQDEDELPCPLCRKPFERPDNGVDGLHTDFKAVASMDSQETKRHGKEQTMASSSQTKRAFGFTLRNAIRLPFSSHWSKATISVSQNGTLLLKMNHRIPRMNQDELFLFKYHEQYFHFIKKSLLDEDLKGCRAFITPNGNRIVLSKTRHLFALFSPKSDLTQTRIMTSQMKQVNCHLGHTAKLMSVSDTRLLFKQKDIGGTTLAVFDFTHKRICDIGEADQRKISSAALNPETHSVVVLKHHKKGDMMQYFHIYDSLGKQIAQFSASSGMLQRIECCSVDSYMVSSENALYFCDWEGKGIDPSKTVSHSSINIKHKIAP